MYQFNPEKVIMNFKVHRRNKSLAVTRPQATLTQGRSLRKVVPIQNQSQSIFTKAKNIYQSQKDLPIAISLFEEYLAINPHCNEALYLCGVCQLRIGNSEKALLKLRLVADSFQGKMNALLLEAMALNKLGKVQASLSVVNQCIKRYPSFEEALCFRGKLLLGMGQFRQAQKDFSWLASRNQSSFLPHHALGDCYRAQGHPKKALQCYLNALEKVEDTNEELVRQVRLKVGTCFYQLQKWSETLEMLEPIKEKTGDCYYYMGVCEVRMGRKQKGILHLEYCLRVSSRHFLMNKAFKQLIMIHLADRQFYEALQVVQLARQTEVILKGWTEIIEAFMMVIKGHFEEASKILTEYWSELKSKYESKKMVKLLRDNSHPQSRYNSKSDKKSISFSKIISKRQSIEKCNSIQKKRNFSTRSVLRPKVITNRSQKQSQQWNYSLTQKQLMIPLILQFKAYAEFFQGQLFACLDSYEQYQSFIRDVFGRQSDVSYNKWLCQGMLMADNDMYQQAIGKYNSCIQIYRSIHNTIPLEPVLYKMCILVQTALVNQNSQQSENKNLTQKQQQILYSALQMMLEYQPILANSSIALYFKSLVLFILRKIEDCNDNLELSLKTAEDCSWKWLWAKGVVETKLNRYQEAVKEFSAGLILESKAQLFLGRSIAFLLWSEELKPQTTIHNIGGGSLSMRKSIKKQKMQKREQLIQNCFEDLQKFIELETDQQIISLWVSKILFFNGAYDEASRSIVKIKNITEEIQLMKKSVAIYDGNFMQGGDLGQLIKQAFDGNYIKSNHKFQKWLITLNLFVKQQYSELLKHLQRQLFSCKDLNEQALLRFDVGIIYLILGEEGKAISTFKTLVGEDDPFELESTLIKLQTNNFVQHQCFQQLKEDLGMNCTKLLSSYLPYKSVHLSSSTTIYLRPSIPFPKFNKPSLSLQISKSWIIKQINISAVEKKLEAPWIRRAGNMKVQFTSELQQSEWFGQTKSMQNTPSLQTESLIE